MVFIFNPDREMVSNLEAEKHYLKKFGARLLSEANDLKRTPEALAEEIGWEIEEVAKVIQGECSETKSIELARAMVKHYPISLHDVWVERDDTDGGVRVLRARDAERSSRVFERPTGNGGSSPYYEYRDAAMSRLAPYRPEWIKELRYVSDSDPLNKEVVFNHGHLMHQVTFFIGKVNFYWKDNGQTFCKEMNTGDSCYITPFVPHSFTARSELSEALIIAVTFGDMVKAAQASLSHVSSQQLSRVTGHSENYHSNFSAKLRRYCEEASIRPESLIDLLIAKGLTHERALAIVNNEDVPDEQEALHLSQILDMRPTDFAVSNEHEDKKVVIRHASEEEERPYPSRQNPVCFLTELARNRHIPSLRSFVIRFKGPTSDHVDFEIGLHQFLYNYGEETIFLKYGASPSIEIHPGDSAYIRPFSRYALSGPTNATLLAVRIPGQLTGAVFDELSRYGADGVDRVVMETKKWF